MSKSKMIIPETTKDLFDEIKMRNLKTVADFIQDNPNLFRPDNWVKIIELMRADGILTSWNTINVTADTPVSAAEKLYELDDKLLHPELLRTIYDYKDLKGGF